MNLLMRLGVIGGDAGLDGDALADRALGRLLDLAVLERLERHLAPDDLLLEHLVQGAQAVLGRGPQDHVVLAELDARVGSLEVEAGAGLAVGLVDGVADLLHVDLRDHVERGHARHDSAGARRVAGHARRERPTVATVAGEAGPVAIWSRLAGRCPSGQREQTVNLPAQPTKVRILPGPRLRSLAISPTLPGADRGPGARPPAVHLPGLDFITMPLRMCPTRILPSLADGGRRRGAGDRHERVRATPGRGPRRWV